MPPLVGVIHKLLADLNERGTQSNDGWIQTGKMVKTSSEVEDRDQQPHKKTKKWSINIEGAGERNRWEDELLAKN
jgi:hypothetical protein